MGRQAKLFLSFLAMGSLAASADEPLKTIVPMGIGTDADPAKVAATMRVAKKTAGLTRFALHAPGHSVRLSGCYDTAGYREVGRRIRAIQDLVKDDGIEVAYLMGPTMNAGCNLPWPAQVLKDGSTCPFRPCPGDPQFQRDFAEHCAAVAAECKPFLYMMEDDYRYMVTGCLCGEHVKRLSKATGRNWTREALLAAMAERSNAALRVAWDDLLMEDLYAISRLAEKAIHGVSPATRIGIAVPGALRTDRVTKLARVLAGPKHRPFCRWQGALYGYDKPIQMPETLFAPTWAVQNVGDGIDNYYEADNCPGSAYYGSGAALVGMCSQMFAAGADELWYWAVRGGTDFSGSRGASPCLTAYARTAARLAAIRDEARRGRPVGVSVPYNTAVQLAWPFGATGERSCDSEAWARYFGLVGLPYAAVRADPPVEHSSLPRCYSGVFAFDGMTDAEVEAILAGNVFLDGEAAEILTERGFAKLIGVTGERRGKVDFTGERVVGTGERISSCFHQNFGLDSSTVTRLKIAEGASSGQRQAEAVSIYYCGKPENVVQPSITRFVNAKGGRVVVMALDLAHSKATNLYNDGKRNLIVSMLDWLNGGLVEPALPGASQQSPGASQQSPGANRQTVFPVRTDTDVLVSLTANEDAAKTRLFVHALNLGGDAREGLSFIVAEPYRGGAVEILDGATWRKADFTWNGNRLAVRAPLHIFDTMALRIKR